MGMLVLQRRVSEVLEIGDDITITVVDVVGNKVRLGIVAPKNIPVHRAEIGQLIRDQKATTEPHDIGGEAG